MFSPPLAPPIVAGPAQLVRARLEDRRERLQQRYDLLLGRFDHRDLRGLVRRLPAAGDLSDVRVVALSTVPPESRRSAGQHPDRELRQHRRGAGDGVAAALGRRVQHHAGAVGQPADLLAGRQPAGGGRHGDGRRHGFTFVAATATPSGNQVQLGASFGGSIANLVAALQASSDPQAAKNNYASRSSNYDSSYALDIWSKVIGPAGSGMSVACSSAGALINGTPALQVPGLVVMCWGINDVRTGATSQAQLVALLTQAVNRIRAVLPTTDIVLWGPNTFLADDPTGAGLVTPSGNAQAYSSLLYGAYRGAEERLAERRRAAEAGYFRQDLP